MKKDLLEIQLSIVDVLSAIVRDRTRRCHGVENAKQIYVTNTLDTNKNKEGKMFAKKAVPKEKSDLYPETILREPTHVHTYSVAVRCANCGYKDTIDVKIKRACARTCPRCKYGTLRFDDARSY